MSKKRKKAFYPTSNLMHDAFEDILKADKFIVITQREDTHEASHGILNKIKHETSGPRETQHELESWAEVMKDKADVQEELNEYLVKSNIKKA